MAANEPATAPKVTFAVIGPGKGGTTWIYEVLAAHPEVCMASAKETMFFDQNFDRGVEWYHRLFPDAPDATATGEVSNTYIGSPVAPARMAAYNPALQLVASLRNPVDRAFSHYLFLLRNDRFRGSFEEVVERRQPDVLEQGRYGSHLSRYLARFPREQLLVLAFDDLVRDAAGYARNLLEFLQVDPSHIPPVAGQRVLSASRPRSRLAARTVKKAAVTVRRAGVPQLVTRVKRSPAVSRALYRPYAEAERPRLAEPTRRRLEDWYADDVARLGELTGRDWATLWFSRV
jgi:hypothetical protein